jgi:hypothetical protein
LLQRPAAIALTRLAQVKKIESFGSGSGKPSQKVQIEKSGTRQSWRSLVCAYTDDLRPV